ncbi:hypothetical protein AU490_02390 [Lonsdalea populi]|uniref:Uncharacterized protein n=1 Tax=Lonsdalea populi TaxID=1172565 RepID=A0A3N0USA0_9GAMM|nr:MULTISPECIES: hypothetical protein [Lonsdalea]RAT18735.1 hypothetical protein AU486_00180 [Lonsdalea quercina]RAT30442.1 hypothetical protein AU490_02390 [Lonsdalea populi]RAT39182.1 hypothetical protein AU491_01935 [Lonsdalea populi]RAT49404.1 hypothetical protein AU496_01140 [Lonsdalea populi]RAT55891.1 hypothetical protein AU497_01295 [Lonsdalea populi]
MPTSFEHQLDTLLDRFNFHFTKYQINQVRSTSSRSRDGFKQEILADVHSDQRLQDKIVELGELALQLDTRQIEVFKITDEAVRVALKSFFANIKLTTERVISEAFPFPIENEKNLAILRTGTIYPVFRDSVTIGAHVYSRLIASTVVDKDVEEPVPANHLSQTGLSLQKTDTVFMMKRKVRTQLFHAIYWCSNASKLILSVDRNALTLSASQDQLFILRQFLMTNGVDYGHAINVFGAIEPIYNAVDGFVTKLGHVTTDGNPVRIPLRGRQECLKKDHYHQAGEGGGHVHAKFAIAKKWKFKFDKTSRTLDVEVGLMGQPKMLDTAQPLTDFSVNKVRRLEDLTFAIEKVLSHTP